MVEVTLTDEANPGFVNVIVHDEDDGLLLDAEVTEDVFDELGETVLEGLLAEVA